MNCCCLLSKTRRQTDTESPSSAAAAGTTIPLNRFEEEIAIEIIEIISWSRTGHPTRRLCIMAGGGGSTETEKELIRGLSHTMNGASFDKEGK
jgi:hypothetical protein